MCGRFIITKKAEDITERFHVNVDESKYQPIYNAAPSQNLPVITNQNPEILSFYRWGLIPYWAKDASIGYKMINARAETLSTKPSFKKALRNQRCLVVADGFYEWKKADGKKQAFRIFIKNEKLFSFAGLWDIWKDAKGKEIYSFTIITTEPNSLIAQLHHRMPVILSEKNEKLWLDKNFSPTDAHSMLVSFPAENMDYHEVSDQVNSASNNYPELLLKI